MSYIRRFIYWIFIISIFPLTILGASLKMIKDAFMGGWYLAPKIRRYLVTGDW